MGKNPNCAEENLNNEYEETLSLVEKIIEEGCNLAKQETIDLKTPPNKKFDLDYNEGTQVPQIREITNPGQRILTAIGYLDVINNPRYNTEGWWCNNYATDLLRILIGDENIGSLYYKDNGKPDLYDPFNPPSEGTYFF